MLAAVTTSGLEAVLVAVEVVLESGAINAEQVLNVLARVNERMPPERAETAFQIIEEPLADTGRYDVLRRDLRPES